MAGWRLAAVSNAGFECVAIADNLGRFTLPPFGPSASSDGQFVAFVKQQLSTYRPEVILSGSQELPTHDRDLMYFIVMSPLPVVIFIQPS